MARANVPPHPHGAKRKPTKPYGQHWRNPAGSKLMRRAFRKATGKKWPTYKQALEWYRKLPGPSIFNPDGVNIERNARRRAAQKT